MDGVSDKDIDNLINGKNRKEVDQETIRRMVYSLMGAGFDTVQIFCTKFKPGEGDTMSYSDGYGNWYARYGQVGEWVNKAEAVAVD